jgi:PilZ domain
MKRRDARVPVNKPIVLTVLGEPEVRLPATVKDASPRGLGLQTAERVKPGAAVKIEIGDAIFLGEVIYCRDTEEGSFIGVQLSQVLTGLAALQKMVEEFEALLHPAPVG